MANAGVLLDTCLGVVREERGPRSPGSSKPSTGACYWVASPARSERADLRQPAGGPQPAHALADNSPM
ncbi:MAG: hypothetical protein ACRDZ4_03075 [Egibacteraceae bacterium]